MKTCIRPYRASTIRCLFVLLGVCSGVSCMPSRRSSNTLDAVAWLEKWPDGIMNVGPQWTPKSKQPSLTYEEWLVEGRRIPKLQRTLIQLLDARDKRVDLPLVAQTLSRIGDSTACSSLLNSLTSSDSNLRCEVCQSLGLLRCQGALSTLCSVVIHDPDENVRANAAVALGRLGDSQARSSLEQAAHDPVHLVSICAADALGRISHHK
jgi:hypothetical protein